jgi:ADP-ribosylglycohydrolase
MQVYAQILVELLAGTDLHSAIHRVQENAGKSPEFGDELAQRFKDVFERKHLSTTEATAQLGQSCPLKNSFPSALLAVVQTPDDFAETLLRVLAVGGDNAGRAAIAGAMLGAHLGYRAIPDSLRQQLVVKDRIAKAVAMILESMSS